MYVCMCVCMFVLIYICCVALRYVVQLFQKIDFGTYYVYHNELLVVSVSVSHLRAGHYWAWSSHTTQFTHFTAHCGTLSVLALHASFFPVIMACLCFAVFEYFACTFIPVSAGT